MKYYIKKYQEPYEPLNKNYPEEVMKYWWLGDDKKFKEAVKNYDNYYGTILPEAEITGSKTIPTKTSDWTSEHNTAEDNKKYEQAHQAESLKIASAVSNKMHNVGNKIGLGMTAAVGAGYLAPATMAGWSAFSAAHPLIATGVDGALTAHGVYNLFGENGILKTYNHFKNGEVGKGLLSGAVDALDVMGGASLLSKTKNILNPMYRAGHAYVNIHPIGYDKPFQKGKAFVEDLLRNKPADINNPKWSWDKDGTANTYINVDDLFNGVASEISAKTRDDAWRKYLGLPENNNMYMDNLDGTYSYNLNKLNELSKGTLNPKLDYSSSLNNIGETVYAPIKGKDFLTGAGGGLTGNYAKLTEISSDGTKFGTQTITDTWDLHPFKSKKISDKIYENLYNVAYKNEPYLEKYKLIKNNPYLDIWIDGNRYTRLYNNGKLKLIPHLLNPTLNNIITRFSKNKLTNWLDDKISNFEVGPILGGKPFEMKTEIPFKIDKINGFDRVFSDVSKWNTKGLHFKQGGSIKNKNTKK